LTDDSRKTFLAEAAAFGHGFIKNFYKEREKKDGALPISDDCSYSLSQERKICSLSSLLSHITHIVLSW